MAATMSSFGSLSSSLTSVFIVTGSGDAKISASTMAFSSDMRFSAAVSSWLRESIGAPVRAVARL